MLQRILILSIQDFFIGGADKVITNADITIYNKIYNKEEGSNVYHRTVLCGVNWQDTTIVQPVANGIISADVTNIYIPFLVETNKQYRKPKNFITDSDKNAVFTLSPEDIVVKGILDLEIASQKDIQKLKDSVDDVRVIASVETNENGSIDMQHWKVVAE